MLTIERKWQPHDRVTLSFDMPLRILHGQPSYTGYLALKRGPQVLAQDSVLNAALATDKWALPALGPPSGKDPALTDAGALLPAYWIGSQAYLLPAGVGNIRPLVLTPFADAGQSGGPVHVWLAPEKK